MFRSRYATLVRSTALVSASILAIPALVPVPTPALAQTANWSGTNSSNWFDPGNWQNGNVPGAGDDVDIDTATPNEAVLDGAVPGGPKATVGQVTVGRTSTGVLTIRNGGILDSVLGPSGQNVIGGLNPGSHGTVTVTGSGSLWSMNGGLTVGPGSLVIEDGGRVTAIGTTIAGLSITSGSIVTVTGSGSSFETNDIVEVGVDGEGTLTIAAGGVVTSASGLVGANPNIPGTVTVTGSGSRWSMNNGLGGNPGTLVIGDEGTGTVTVADGGVVSASGPITISQQAGSTGTLNIGAAAGQSAAPAGDLQAATIAFGAGTGTINFNHTEDNYSFAPALSGNGTVNVLAGTTILTGNSGAFTGTANLTGGTLQVDGTLGGTTTVQSGATLAGTGTVGGTTIANGGTIAPGASIGTLNVNGNITFEAGSTYQVEVAGTDSDLIHATGTAAINGGSARVSADGTVDPSATYTILTADGGVSGTFDGVSSNFAFLNPMLAYNANNVLLTLERNDTRIDDVAHTTNQRSVARVIEQFPNDNSLFHAVLSQTVSGARQAFDALHGELHATIGGVLVDESRYVRDSILGRLMQATHTNATGQQASLASGGPQISSPAASTPQAMALGYASGADAPAPRSSGPTFWTRGFGAWGDFDGDGNAASIDRSLGGFVSGMDAMISPGWRAGFGAGASFSDIDVDRRLSSGDVDSYHLAGYLGGHVGAFAVRGGGAWTWSDIDTSRAIAFPGFFERASASYDADTGQIFGEVAYPTHMGRFALEPFAGLAYVHFDADSFREHGQTAALRGRSNEEEVGSFTLGMRAATTAQWGAYTVTPHISAAWQHAFEDITPQSRLAFASTGGDFAVAGVPLAKDSALIDAGLDVALGPNMTAGISYSGQLGDDVTDNAVKGSFSWRF